MVTPSQPRHYFTRVSIYFDQGRHLATNYARGTVVPVNTGVQLVGVGRSAITVELARPGGARGARLVVENVPKYTRVDVNTLFGMLLSEQPLDLSHVRPEFIAAMQAGLPRLGMTKQEVVMARGYPPSHATPSLDLDRWVYWSSRFVKQTLAFENNVLVRGRGLS